VFDERSIQSQGAEKRFGQIPHIYREKHPLAEAKGEEAVTLAHLLITHLGDCAKARADLDLDTLK
jgi:hypothetical protein